MGRLVLFNILLTIYLGFPKLSTQEYKHGPYRLYRDNWHEVKGLVLDEEREAFKRSIYYLPFAEKCQKSNMVMANDTTKIASEVDHRFGPDSDKPCFIHCLTYAAEWTDLDGKFYFQHIKQDLLNTTLSRGGVKKIFKKCLGEELTMEIIINYKLTSFGCRLPFNFVKCLWRQSMNPSMHKKSAKEIMQPVCLLSDSLFWNYCFITRNFKERLDDEGQAYITYEFS